MRELARALGELNATNAAWALQVGGVHGWEPIAEMYGDGLVPLVGRVRSQLGGCEPRVAASALQLGMSARLWSVAVGCAALSGQVPALEELCWRDTNGSVTLGLATLHPVDAAGLTGQVMGALQPLTAAVAAEFHLAPALLWGNAASALAGVDRIHRRPEITAITDELLRAEPFAGHLAHGRRARTCCLFYRVGGFGLCADCVFDAPPGALRQGRL